MNTLGRILLVEDDPKDVELTLTALDDTTSRTRLSSRPTVNRRLTIFTTGEGTRNATARIPQFSCST